MSKKACIVLCLVSIYLSRYVNADTIVNIDARVHSTENPISIVLDTGDWLITPIDTSMGGAFTAWNAWGVSGRWLNFYVVESETIPSTIVGEGWDQGQQYPTPEIAFENASAFEFSLLQQESINLSITDNSSELFDNQGGMSLSIVQIPEPATILLLAFGGLALRKKK